MDGSYVHTILVTSYIHGSDKFRIILLKVSEIAWVDADQPCPFHGLPAQKSLNSREWRILYTYNNAYYVTRLRMDRAGVPLSETSQGD